MHIIQDNNQWDLSCAALPIDLIGQIGQIELKVLLGEKNTIRITFIYIALYKIHIVSKQLHSNKQVNKRANSAKHMLLNFSCKKIVSLFI